MARQELELLKGWRACLYDLKRDRDTVLEAYANVTLKVLVELTPEERNSLYKILKVRVVVRDDGGEWFVLQRSGTPQCRIFSRTKRHALGVLHVDAQLDARQVQPIVRQVQRRLHKRRARRPCPPNPRARPYRCCRRAACASGGRCAGRGYRPPHLPRSPPASTAPPVAPRAACATPPPTGGAIVGCRQSPLGH